MSRIRIFAAVVLAFGLSTCSGENKSPEAPSNINPPISPKQIAMVVTVKVSNTKYLTALPEDFQVDISGANIPSFRGSVNPGTIVLIPVGSTYSVRVSSTGAVKMPDGTSSPTGYRETFSQGCSGTMGESAVECTVIEEEQPFECNPRLWSFVYSSFRLEIRDKANPCRVITGTVQRTERAADSDGVLYVNPDQQFAQLLTSGNPNGLLVVELVCNQETITQKDVPAGICNGYPELRWVIEDLMARRILIAGWWVLDGNHPDPKVRLQNHLDRWAELHPARIIVLPR